ncbi:interferon-induced protein 44-like [Engraulis encrasicolus]|uniref:interferon-induced protein 44-like n=1 Tax=Engraulis encrasicolus TaxID=184585 RepID=UPI002FCFF3C3
MFRGSWFSTTPEFKSTVPDQKVKREQKVEIKVNVNLEDLKVDWTKDGATLFDGGRIHFSQKEKTLTLTIDKVEEVDDGKYTVTITKDSRSASYSVKVTVLDYEHNWRVIRWGEKVDVMHGLEDMALKNPETKHVRLLLLGPVGAGKSSIINSINSIFQDRVMIGTLVAATPSFSFTRNYNTYEITTKQGKALPFVFNDIMGLETSAEEGIHLEDIKSVIGGHIPEDYMFDPSHPLSSHDRRYNISPALSDRVHCLVSVVAADRVSPGLDKYLEKMREVRKHASKLSKTFQHEHDLLQ